MCGQTKCQKPCASCTCKPIRVVALSVPLNTALALAESPYSFLECYSAVKRGALKFCDWTRRDGGKFYLRKHGDSVQITGTL
jgi:hypothetical protein